MYLIVYACAVAKFSEVIHGEGEARRRRADLVADGYVVYVKAI